TPSSFQCEDTHFRPSATSPKNYFQMSKRNREDNHGSISNTSKRNKSRHDESNLMESCTTTTARTLSHEDYTVGWICALPCEMAAAKVMLDDIHPGLPNRPNDHNNYILGTIGVHNVVVACLPSYGTTCAATGASQMLSSFESVRF